VTKSHSHSHSHEHAHSHEHEHEHDHEHEHEHERPLLEANAGAGKILFLDTASGIAGDMTIAALVDLGVPFAVVEQAIAAVPIDGYRLELRSAYAGAIGASQFDVILSGGQGERGYGEIDAMLGEANLVEPVKALARRAFRILAEAESEVHRIPLERVHFHEVGAVDAIADIVGSAACLCYLGATLLVSPLPMGRGFVTCRHGVLPLPAPATVGCLRGIPTYDAGVDAELVTPTGAAIVAAAATGFVRWPNFAPERIGWGRGTRELPDRPNALRAILGSAAQPLESPSATHVVLETNVDDMTGELVAHAIGSLLAAGALDAWAAPITMKKGRPALTLSVLADEAHAERLAEVLLTETSSIGLRRYSVERRERPRRVVQVATRFGVVPVKISEGPYGPAQLKPEFDACVAAAKSFGVPVREVLAEALRAAAKT
jgi:pyridinium-3,5-bisthiocarboxylic acid mononucleotide nickel chelatase